MKTAKYYLVKYSRILELFIASALAIGIAIGFIDLAKYFGLLLESNTKETYSVFQGFLGYALLLIVGIELIFMLLSHSTRAILELVLFVIARKMLIYADTMLDLVLGVIAMSLVFCTLHFFMKDIQVNFLKENEE